VDPRGRPDARLGDVLLLCVGVGGLLLCVTLVFLAMRSVMDIGGACAEGGPYVPAQSCPDGATPALLLGVFGGFGFGALGAAYGARVGGYGWVPLLGWTALFAALGWNFLDYGLFNPPEGEGIVWGWLIPGVLFQLMAWVPVWFAVMAWRDARGTEAGLRERIVPNVLRGPGQRVNVLGAPGDNRPPPVPASHRVEVAGGTGASGAVAQKAPTRHEEPARHDELEDIDALMGALIIDAAADAPVDPDLRQRKP